jgi:hypothetical protein
MKNKYLKNFAAYEIVVWITGLIFLFEGFLGKLITGFSLFFLISTIVLITISVWMIYINFCLVLGYRKNEFTTYLNHTKWVNFAQIFNLSLLGVTIHWIEGPYLGLVYAYNQGQMFGVHFRLFVCAFSLEYHQSAFDVILAEINLIPLSIFILLDKLTKEKPSTTIGTPTGGLV